MKNKLFVIILFILLGAGILPVSISTYQRYDVHKSVQAKEEEWEKLKAKLDSLKKEVENLEIKTRSAEEWQSLIDDTNNSYNDVLQELNTKREQLMEIESKLDEIKKYIDNY